MPIAVTQALGLLLIGAVALPVALMHGASPLALALTLLWSLGALRVPRLRAYGLTSLGVPGALGLLLAAGPLESRGLAALLMVLVFAASVSLGWGLEEETRAPWLTALVLFVWQPSSLGAVGLMGLALLASSRWRSGVSWTLGAQRGGARQAWGAALALIAGLTLLTLPLPAPRPLLAPRLPVPRLALAAPAASTVSTPVSSAARGTTAQASLRLPPLWWWTVSAGALGLLLWRGRGHLLPRFAPRTVGLGVKQKSGGRLMLPLMGLSLLVVWLTVFAWRGESVRLELPLLNTSLPMQWLVLLLLGTGLYWAWRLWQRLRGSRGAPFKLESLKTTPEARRDSPADEVRAAYRTWLETLHDLDLRRATWQTPLEYARFVSVHHPGLREHTDGLTRAYERVRYGAVPSASELAAALAALHAWRGYAALAKPESAT